MQEWLNVMEKYKLPDLPYGYKDLEPYMSADVLTLHHDKHHASYVNAANALLDKIQEFMLELGHGFCFEARQKRILIGDEYFFVDLVFYHRVLKCRLCRSRRAGASR